MIIANFLATSESDVYCNYIKIHLTRNIAVHLPLGSLIVIRQLHEFALHFVGRSRRDHRVVGPGWAPVASEHTQNGVDESENALADSREEPALVGHVHLLNGAIVSDDRGPSVQSEQILDHVEDSLQKAP